MKRAIVYVPSLILIFGLAALFFGSRGGASSGPPAPARAAAEVIAAPGRVEPLSEEVRVGSEVSGKLQAVPVEEGDRVRKGQVLAALENSDYRARVAEAEAELRRREAELRRVVNGARGQERQEARAAVKEAEAVLANAETELERKLSLYRSGDIARAESERAEREYRVAQARWDAARQRHALVNDQAREEDRAGAEADVALARARLEEARARLEKTIIRSPLDGVVLRKQLKAGESVSNSANPPMPIVTVGNTSVLRVRADVDETDVGKLSLGRRAYVTADAYPGRKFWGRVVRIGQVLGKKNIRTEEPTERVDTKILETLVELDPGQSLPAGLRVGVFILREDR